MTPRNASPILASFAWISSRKHWSLTALSCIGMLASALPGSGKPNIILIMFDDLGVNDLGAYTYPSKENPGPPPADRSSSVNGKTAPNASMSLTPRIDSLASDGVRMTHFYASQPVCSASRASLMTGCYSRRVRINGALAPNSNNGLNSTEVTLSELLRQSGYFTAMAGKWHLGSKADHSPIRHGFQSYLGILYSNDMWPGNPYNGGFPALNLMKDEAPLESYTTATGGMITGAINTDSEQSYLLEAMTEHALSSIDTAVAQEKPFFLYFSPHAPHVPIQPHPDFLTEGGRVDGVQRYLDLIAEIDHRIGQILDKLNDPDGDPATPDGIADNTLIILTSDNGPWHTRPTNGRDGDVFQGAGSAYPFFGSKHSNWEGGHRVGMLARYPGRLPAGTVLHQTASNMDLMPTLVRLAGGSVPSDRDIDGVDIWPLLTGTDTSEPHDKFYYYGSGSSEAGGVLDLSTPRKFKWINDKLFALETGFTGDFQETTDVSELQVNLKTRLQGAVNSWNSNMTPRSPGEAKSVRIELEDDSVTVPEGGTGSIRVRLSASAVKTVTISRFLGDEDLSVSDGATLDFDTGNWDQWQTVTFSAANDDDDDSGGATFRASAPDLHVREIFVFESDTSPPAPPRPPTGLKAKAMGGGISLDWDTNQEADVIGYTIYRATASGAFGEPLASGVKNSNYFDESAVPGTTYYYVVRAMDDDPSVSGPSAEVSALAGHTPPAPPTGLRITPDGFRMVLDWDDSEASDLAGYTVYRSTIKGEMGESLITGLTSSDFIDETAVPGSIYYYAITALDLDGNESDSLPQDPVLAGPRFSRENSALYYRFDGDPDAEHDHIATTFFDRTFLPNDGNPVGHPMYSTDVFGAVVPREKLPNRISLWLERSRSQYIAVPDHDSIDFGPGSAFTIEAWVKLDTLGSRADGRRQYLVIKKSGANPDTKLNYGFILNPAGGYGDTGSGRNLALLLGNGNTSSAVFSNLEIPDTAWHYVAVRFDDVTNKVRFTLDQQHDDRSSPQSIAANSSQLIVGAHHTASGNIDSYFDGRIDELRISRAWLADDQLLNSPGPDDFRIVELDLANHGDGRISLSFNTIDQQLYSILGSDDLVRFVEVATTIGTGTSTTLVFSDPDAVGKKRRFYKVMEK